MSSTRKRFSQKIKKVFSAIKSFALKRVPLRKFRHPESVAYRPENHLPGHPWDVLGQGERYASVADLCARVYPLPIQVVKLIARDVLRGLEKFHTTYGVGYNNLNTSNIFLSPRDMRSLVSQLCADTQESFRPSRLSLGTVLLDFDSMLTSTSSAVFRLSDVDADAGSHEIHNNRASRAPEVILGAACGPSADIWSLGCLLYELLAGESLFDPLFQTDEFGLSPEESHLIQIIELLGAFPAELLSAGKHSDRWFTNTGTLRVDTTYYPTTLETILRTKVDDGELRNTWAFFDSLLQLRPEDRARAQDMINHPWFTH